MRGFWRFGLFPLFGFTVCYFFLTYPLVLGWSDRFFCDSDDGPEMIWNLWWVDYSVTHLHQLPWHTQLLHYPLGVSLLLDSLSPLNGFLAVPLLKVFSLNVVYNLLLTFAFASSGVTAFWLAYDATKAYWPSLAAGYAFTFSAFHFAHAPGHMHQFTIQLLPVFFLFWLRLLRDANFSNAIAAAAALFGVLLCDDYQFLFCVIAIFISGLWILICRRKTTDLRQLAMSLLIFVCCVSLTSAPLVLAKFFESRHGPYASLRDSKFFHVDLANLFVPGYVWLYHGWTSAIWEPIGSYAEMSISIGVAVIFAAIWGFAARKRIGFDFAGLWLCLAICFAALSLGATLRVMHISVTEWMPYRLLELLIPPLKFAGIPMRMELAAQLAWSVLAAGGLKAISGMRQPMRTPLIFIFVLGMVIESQPRVQTSYPAREPKWAVFLRDNSRPGAVIDLISRDGSSSLYYQTIHHRPIALGYVSRIPIATANESYRILSQAERGDFELVKEKGFRFIVAGTHRTLDLPIIYADSSSRVYSLEDLPR